MSLPHARLAGGSFGGLGDNRGKTKDATTTMCKEAQLQALFEIERPGTEAGRLHPKHPQGMEYALVRPGADAHQLAEWSHQPGWKTVPRKHSYLEGKAR